MLNVLVCQKSNWVSGVQSVCSRNWSAKRPTGVQCGHLHVGLPNVQLGQWSPKSSLAQLVYQMSNCVSGVQMFACAIIFQMSKWVGGSKVCARRAIIWCLCMYRKLVITGNKAIPSSSSRWHLCLHARLFVNWDLLGWYFDCVFSETILVIKYRGIVLLR